MATLETEAGFVALFWRDAKLGKDSAVRIIGHMRAEMLEYEALANAFEYLSGRFAAGHPLDDMEAEAKLVGILGAEWYAALQDEAKKDGKVGPLTKQVLYNYRARKQVALLQAAVQDTEALIGTNDTRAQRVAFEAVGRLSLLHSTHGDLSRPVTRTEITERAIQRLQHRGQSAGVAMPYGKLQDQMGNLLPGDVLAVAGYSGTGKSLMAANLFARFVMAGQPVIAFPTEMGLAWHARAVAAHARIPQRIAEREQWSEATPEQLEAYEFALRDFEQKPWEIVDKSAISPEEIMARAMVLRRRWAGKPVIVMVDHLHRLDYGGKEADFGVGSATREMRNWAKEDEDGGIILILLYQPRKPADELEFYRPVMGHQIRGVSEVWNEIDFLVSPYRRWVKTDSLYKTAWGTQATAYDKDGWPIFATPNADGAKLDDERVYVKVGKRRVGGEGDTVVLHIDSPSGHIYQLEKPKLAVVGATA